MRIVSVVLALLLSAGPAAAADWTRHTNGRFGVSVEIPASFRMLPPPENGDGFTFVSPDGRARIAAWGSYMIASGDMVGFSAYKDDIVRDAAADGLKIIYQAGGRDWVAYSGLKGSTIVYNKSIAGCRDVVNSIQIEYPQSERNTYDPIVTHVANSLRHQDGWGCSK